MKLTIFAATGGIGRHALNRALAAGHDVTAVARNPATFQRRHGPSPLTCPIWTRRRSSAAYFSEPNEVYADSVGQTRQMVASGDGGQPGDPAKAAAAILTALLVTGSTGSIGGAVVRALPERGALRASVRADHRPHLATSTSRR